MADAPMRIWLLFARVFATMPIAHPMTMSPDQHNGAPSVAARFQTTHWSIVLKAGQGAEEALLKLCRIYWLPLYAFTRRRGHPVHEAQDLTQGFFVHLLENRGIETVARDRGRFRSFLLVALKHYLDNEWHKTRTIKRGGHQLFISWDELNPEERDRLEPSDDLTPEKLFNRQWALKLLERVMNQLQKECVAARKGDLFDKLKDYLTGAAGEKTYRQLAAELNMSESAIKVSVHRLRRRFGELVREQVERTVANPEEVDDEIRELFSALG
jgi:RNA polymerase sigma factor (sigma-70 family)